MFSDLISDDFADFEGLEAVTYIARRDEEEDIPIDHALPGEITQRELALSSLIPDGAVTRVWSIRKFELDDFDLVPREGDVIQQEDGTEWTIRGISLRSLGARYRFACTLGRE